MTHVKCNRFSRQQSAGKDRHSSSEAGVYNTRQGHHIASLIIRSVIFIRRISTGVRLEQVHELGHAQLIALELVAA
jgi:hypothetical protein